jgi:outer membrane biosynthesis protein TonB
MRAAQNMARENIMRPHAAGIILTALAWMLSGSAVAHAQDAVPETPPELRDFRLDQPRPEAQPQTEPTTQPPQQPVPPPAVRTAPEPEQAAPITQATQQAPRSAASQSPRNNTPATETEAAPNPAVDDTKPVSPEATPVDPKIDAAVAPTASAEPAPSSWNLNLLFGVAAGVLAILGFAVVALRRRRLHTSDVEGYGIAEAAVPQMPSTDPVDTPKPAPSPASPPAKLPALAEAKSADVSITFIPEKATISFTNLTVQGQLQIANESKVLAKDMQLRAVLLSASSQQQLAIDTFFSDPTQIAPNALGEAKPGERLGLSLELSVPLSEMQTFPLGDQRLLVPILVASLSYAGDNDETSAAHLACMIGREAQPPKPKMGPLRLDKGPRSFAPLGQRPVYT